MLCLLLDEDFNNDILRGLLRRRPDIDVVRVQAIPAISGAADPTVLAWAAQEQRVIFTHDVTTMTVHAITRVEAGQPMPGIFAVSQDAPIGPVIEDMLLLAECSKDGEWEGQIHYLPFK